MKIQEYDLNIVHTKGTNNFFADASGRNPIGMTDELSGWAPTDIFLSTIN
jgi:hypothetical protein